MTNEQLQEKIKEHDELLGNLKAGLLFDAHGKFVSINDGYWLGLFVQNENGETDLEKSEEYKRRVEVYLWNVAEAVKLIKM